MKNWFTTIVLSATMLATVAGPVAVRAFGQQTTTTHTERYYDSEQKDYHDWTPSEQRAYRHYYTENHQEYRDWKALNDEQRQDYWRWRHQHTGDFPERTDMPRDTH